MRGSAREFDRVNATIPVQFEGGVEGETRNLSPSGVFFVVDEEMKTGGSLRFTLEFDSAGGKLYMDCIGEIVRVQQTDGKIGVAAKITESRLERRAPALAQGGMTWTPELTAEKR